MASASRLNLLAIFALSIVCYNEWIVFVLKSKTWIKLNKSDDYISILLVADPQILSSLSEPYYPFSIAAVWDSNRFVSKAYGYAIQHTNPDVVIFLGDLINDGSIASQDDYVSLVSEFKNLFPQPSSAKVVFAIAGDNDVGGEGSDPVTELKIARFHSSYNNTDFLSYKFLDIYHVNRIYGSPTSLSKQHHAESYHHSIVISHFPLTSATKKNILAKIIEISPSFIFSAHDHDSYRFVSTKDNPKANQFHLLRSDDRSKLELKLDTQELNEISVPTCSYRMGKKHYGFGHAVIRTDNVLEYCVLWLPSRFVQLAIYLILFFLACSFYIWPLVRFLFQFYELERDKIHKV